MGFLSHEKPCQSNSIGKLIKLNCDVENQVETKFFFAGQHVKNLNFPTKLIHLLSIQIIDNLPEDFGPGHSSFQQILLFLIFRPYPSLFFHFNTIIISLVTQFIYPHNLIIHFLNPTLKPKSHPPPISLNLPPNPIPYQ